MHTNRQPGFFTPTKWKIIVTLLFIFALLYYFFSSICLEWMGSNVTCPEITLTKQIINTIVYLPIVTVVAPIIIFYETLENTVGAATGVIFVTMMIIGIFLELFYLYAVACLSIWLNKKVKKELPLKTTPEKPAEPYENNKPKEGVFH